MYPVLANILQSTICREEHGDSVDVPSLESELQTYKSQLEKKAKAVRFDDILDDSAPGRMGGIRRKLKKEDQKQRVKKEVGLRLLFPGTCRDTRHLVSGYV